jgi:hypothetical protein
MSTTVPRPVSRVRYQKTKLRRAAAERGRGGAGHAQGCNPGAPGRRSRRVRAGTLRARILRRLRRRRKRLPPAGGKIGQVPLQRRKRRRHRKPINVLPVRVKVMRFNCETGRCGGGRKLPMKSLKLSGVADQVFSRRECQFWILERRGAHRPPVCPRASLHRLPGAIDCRRSRRDTSPQPRAPGVPNARG